MQATSSPAQAPEGAQSPSGFNLFNIFRCDLNYYDGVPRINIYLLRLLFTLMFVFLSFDAWQHIITHTGPWDNANAAAWCMWAGYASISFIGMLYPLKMLPIVLFEVIYKTTWLVIVAYPLWVTNHLAGSRAEGMTRVFVWVVFPLVAMPWRYFYKTYILGRRKV